MNSRTRVTPSARLSLSDHPRLISTVLVLFLGAMCFQTPAVAGTFNVSDAAGLRAALLTAATNGQDDVIVLAAGTYANGGTTFSFVTNESNTLTLQGASGTTRDQVILDGGGNSSVLNFNCLGISCGAITLQGLTMQNSSVVMPSQSLILSDVSFFYGTGGMIYGFAVTVTNSTFSNNTAGGYFAITGSDVSIANSTFSNIGAGAIAGRNNVTVANSTFSNNAGGGIYGNGAVTVTSSTFSNNAGGSAIGGGTANNRGQTTFISCKDGRMIENSAVPACPAAHA